MDAIVERSIRIPPTGEATLFFVSPCAFHPRRLILDPTEGIDVVWVEFDGKLQGTFWPQQADMFSMVADVDMRKVFDMLQPNEQVAIHLRSARYTRVHVRVQISGPMP